MFATGSGGFKFITGTSLLIIGLTESNCSSSLGEANFFTFIVCVLQSELEGVFDYSGFIVIYIMFWGVDVLLKTPLITSAFDLLSIICPSSVKATSERGSGLPFVSKRGLTSTLLNSSSFYFYISIFLSLSSTWSLNYASKL